MSKHRKKAATRRQTAGGVIYDASRRRLLLIKSAQDGTWMLPRGRREPGESLAETARREGREETGVTAQVEGKLHVEQARRVVRHFFLLRKKQGKGFDRRETERVKWFAPRRALAKVHRSADRLVVSTALRTLGWA